MSPAKAQPDDPVVAKLDEIVRLLALNLKRDRPLAEVIEEMAGVGFGQKRMSELLGTSSGYVDNIVVRARNAKKKPAAKKKAAAKKP